MRKFLLPFAAALAALAPTVHANSVQPNSNFVEPTSISSGRTENNSREFLSAPPKIAPLISKDQLFDFVLSRPEQGLLVAGHRSHSSHRSHRSHYSSR